MEGFSKDKEIRKKLVGDDLRPVSDQYIEF